MKTALRGVDTIYSKVNAYVANLKDATLGTCGGKGDGEDFVM